MNHKIIAVDFDGTLCEHKYPEIGEPNRELIDHLIEEQQHGAKLILWTCRCGYYVSLAFEWCWKQGLKFDAVNRNVTEAIAMFGEDSRKVFAHEYIDDRASTRFKLPFVKE